MFLNFTIANVSAVADLILRGVQFTIGSVTIWPHPQFLLVILGLVGAALSMKWLITSVEMMSDMDDIKHQYDQESGQLDNGALTSLIVGAMAYYRDKKTTIHRLGFFSRAAGLCFLVSSALQAIRGMQSGSEIGIAGPILVVISVVLSSSVGIAGILIPRYFFKYSVTWEYRLNESVKAERELRKLMENN